MKKIVSFMLAIFMSIAVLQAPLTVYAESANALKEPDKVSVFRVEITDALSNQIYEGGALKSFVHLETLLPTQSYVFMDKKGDYSWEVKLDNMTSENWRTLCAGVTFFTTIVWHKPYFSFDGPNVVSVKQQGNAMVAKLDVTRTVDFEVGTNGNVADKPAGIIQANGTSIISPPMPDNNHYFCTGWRDGNTTYKVGEKITLTKNLTLTATWEKYNQFEVKYVDGVDGLDIAVPTTKAYYTDETASAENMIGSRPNYDFDKWIGSDGKNYAVGEEIELKDKLTLTADWKEHAKCKVEYADNVEGSDIAVPTTKTYYTDENVLAENMIGSRPNYDFKGWVGSDGKNYAVGEKIELIETTDNLVLTAVWQEHAKSKVEYAIGCDDSSITPPPPQEDYVGKSITVAEGLKRDNFDFKGWKGSNGTLYAVGDKFTLTKDNLVLTAQWEELAKIKVTYADGVEGLDVAVPTEQIDYIGKDITLGNAISRENFDFSGWQDSDKKIYTAGQSIKLTQNLSLTATWKRQSIKVDQIQVILSDKRVNELAPGLWLVSEVHLEKGRGFDYTIVKRAEKEWFFNPKDVNYQNYDSKYSGITVLNTKLIKRPVYPFKFSDPTIRVTLKKDTQLYLNCKRTGSLLTIYLD